MMTTSTKLPVSVIILTHRADDRLKRSLASVTWAGEVIVVDDATEIDWKPWQANHSFTLVKRPQPLADFAQARNEALTYASQPWVLFLDSDEVVPNESVPLLAAAVSDTAEGVWIKRRDVFYGQKLKWGEVKDSYLLRLGQKDKLRFERPIHEVGNVSGATKASKIEIEHYSHPNLSDFWRSVVSHAQREAEFRYRRGDRFSLFQLIVFPPAKTLYTLVFKLGILDGWRGVMYSLMMSVHSLLVRVFLYEKRLNQK